ncbi:PmoA family protein [Leifsonia sp. Leaf264]|uniref:DUF6807 domain-containing protein n=1 Tax=Leifsonia sp. Leaf264 TaxID=1736314 RepID=UPI0006FAC934|nr:PmoA family protein [Leifsonia sp. Leaf264]KQO97044.1 hypothetical protein ASF30_18535 [Leifsonia sp. Leaf264]
MSITVTHELDSHVVIRDGDVELARYTYRPDTVQLESPKPYLHPLRTRSGDPVTLFRPHDHVWHKGIAWSLPHVGEENFWGGPTYVHGQFYVQLENNGRAEHERMTELVATADAATIAHRLRWVTQGGQQIIEEDRRISAHLVDDAWVLVFETVMRNTSEATISIGSPTTKGRENAGYGGLFWRGPRSFTGGTVRTPLGDGGDELRGSRLEWMGFTGRQDGSGGTSTLVIVDDTENPRHPPQWFARSEEFACLCPAPFFSEELEFGAGESLRFRYAVVIADGYGEEGGAARLADLGRGLLAARRAETRVLEDSRS